MWGCGDGYPGYGIWLVSGWQGEWVQHQIALARDHLVADFAYLRLALAALPGAAELLAQPRSVRVPSSTALRISRSVTPLQIQTYILQIQRFEPMPGI